MSPAWEQSYPSSLASIGRKRFAQLAIRTLPAPSRTAQHSVMAREAACMEQQQRSGLTSTGLKKSAQMVTRTLPAFGPCASTPTSVMPVRPCHRIGRSTRSNASSTNCLHAGALLRAQQAHTFTRQLGTYPACQALRLCHARTGVHAALSKQCLYHPRPGHGHC